MSMLPQSITQLLQTYVSIQRLEAFFDEPEVESWVSTLNDVPSSSPEGKVAIINGTFRYQDITTGSSTAAAAAPAAKPTPDRPLLAESETAVEGSDAGEQMFELRDINVEFPRGKLTLVAGKTLPCLCARQ